MNSVVAVKTEAKPVYRHALVPTNQCFLIWKDVRDLLEAAVLRSHGRWTMEQLCAVVCTGLQSLWVTYDEEGYIRAAMTTQIVQYPNTKFIAVQFLGGDDFEAWCDGLLDLIERYGKDTGCSGVETVARLGFRNFFKRRGYDQSYATYETSLEDSSHG